MRVDTGDQKVIQPNESSRKLRLAIAGCAHGEMDKIYAVLAEIEKAKGYKFDLLVCCGDYQSVRNYGDLHHMHVSAKYRSLQTFYKYYSGEKEAPILTVFVGGNHEASGYLSELPNGGWVAPKIYYMGFANVIRFAGLRIGGLSGIFNGKEFNRGHYERPPYTIQSDVISSYHVRNIDVWRMKQLRPADDDYTSNPIDIMITHDWPAGIVEYGNKDQLLRVKPFFHDDIQSGKLGNPSTMQLLYDIRPRYWLAAHLHVGFAALVPHVSKDGAARSAPTRFLALDKPIPRRHFIQALELDIAPDAEMKLSYDPEWLAVLRNTDAFTSTSRSNTYLPTPHCEERWDFRPTESELAAVAALGDLTIPENFRQTAPPLKEDTPKARLAPSSAYYRNPQSAEFCSWLGISDLNKMLVDMEPTSVDMAHYLKEDSCADNSEIVIDDDVSFHIEHFPIFEDGEDFAIDTRPLPGSFDDFEPPKISTKCDAADDLHNFTPPKILSKKTPAHDSETFVLKRRKVDLPEDDD
ncbi:unnamed protein product [Nippostrongylus brasiliensis]|uniref:Lariat debranching enzyme (inferred by orthology to a C. elegans protein) n=1 Tax=Nippostrongylus brasiliensis TaxID=27835 RepID=A0A0N4XER0_NIPBR|nr:unnamed protein product [Nippostrongylus brasiliensis]